MNGSRWGLLAMLAACAFGGPVGVATAADGLMLVTLSGTVVEAGTNQAVPCRVRILGPDGKDYPPNGHSDLSGEEVFHCNDPVESEPDVSNRGVTWAMLEDGRFTATLPAVDGLRLLVERGIEYKRAEHPLDLAGRAGTVENSFSIERWVNMQSLGWMSGDTHVHSLLPNATAVQMKTEDLHYVNLMFMGTQTTLYSGGHFTGAPALVSTPNEIVYVSQEVRDMQQGHLTVLNMKHPVTPIMVHTGKPAEPTWPSFPNEPLNWDVYDQQHAEGAVVTHSHVLSYPGYALGASAAMGKLDGVEFAQPDMVHTGTFTYLDIQVPGYQARHGGQTWYDMLNCGARLPVSGGTDKMSAWRVVGGTRTYAHVTSWDHDGFIDAFHRGETFVTNGPMLFFSVNGNPMGSEITFMGEGPFKLHIKAACRTDKPLTYFQVVQNGRVIQDRDVQDGEKNIKAAFDVEVGRSGWFALRAGNRDAAPINWENATAAAHSSPVYVTINGQLPAERASADYMIASTKACKGWADIQAVYSSGENKAKALDGYERALAFYTAALERAGDDE